MNSKEVLPLLGPVAEALTYKNPVNEYLKLPKTLGSVDSGLLFELADDIEDTMPYPTNLTIAAAAYTEAVLFSPNRLPADTELIDYAEQLQHDATEAMWDRHHLLRDPDDQDEVLRAEVQLIFFDVYRELLNDRVSPKTRQETYSRLAKVGRYTNTLIGRAHGEYSVSAFGLCTEIAVLLAGLSNEDDTIIIPSTPRGNHGSYHTDTTHDFNFLTLNPDYGTIETAVPIELKAQRDIRDRMAAEARYKPGHVLLLHARELGLNNGTLGNIVGHRELNQKARRTLRRTREGINTNVRLAQEKAREL